MENRVGIYIWKPKKEDRYCVGEWDPSKERYRKETDRENAEIRIKEEIKSKDGTSRYTIDDIDVLYTKALNFYNPDNREKSFDKLIHRNLVSYFGKETQTDTEFFKNTTYKNFGAILIDAVEKTAANDWKSFNPERPYSFSLREGSQDRAVQKMLKAVKNGKKKFLLGAKPRFGKTTTSYFFAKDAKFKNILVMSFRPGDTKNAWRQDLITHQAFSEYSFFDQKQFKEWQDCDTPKVLYMSFQKAKISEADFSNIKGIDLLIIDEDHIGAHRKENRDFVKVLRPKFMLMLTGTPDIELLSNDFSNDEYFRFDYIDEQELKNCDDQKIAELYADMPKLNLYAFDLSQTFADKIFDRDGFQWSEFLKVDDKTGRFIHEPYVNKFLDYLTHTADTPETEDLDLAIFNNASLNLRHGLWKLPSKKACTAMKVLLKDHITFGDYHIEVLPESDLSPKSIEETCAKYPRTIWLTVMKNTVGVTVKQWTYTMSLYGSDSSSQPTYIQYIFRAGSPGKDEFYSFDFCPNRVLQVVSDMAQSRVADGRCDNFNESCKRVLNLLNVYSYKGAGTLKKLDAQEVFRGISENITMMSCENLLVNEVSALKNEHLDEYDGSKVESLGQEISSNKEIKKLKKEFDEIAKEEKEKRAGGSSPKKDDKAFEKFVVRAFVDIYRWIKYHKGDVRDITDFIAKVQSYRGHYSEYFIYSDDFIEALLTLIATSKKKNFSIAIERFSTIRFSYGFTNVPPALADRMVNKFSSLKAGYIVCDPTFSGPGLLRAARAQVPDIIPVVGICDEICEKRKGDFTGRLRVIAEKELNGVTVVTAKTMDELFINLKKICEVKNENNMNIIMNPPYDGRLHLDILAKVIGIFPNAEIVNLSPIRWLQDPLAEYKKASDFKRFPQIRERIESLEVMDSLESSNQFGIVATFDLGVYHITPNGGWQQKENKLLKKMVDRMEDTLKNHIVTDDMDGYAIRVCLFTCGNGVPLERAYQTGFNMPKERAYYTSKRNDFTGDTYLEHRQKHKAGNVQVKAESPNIKFATREERDNFYDSYNTKTLKWMFGAMTVDVHVHPQFLPWLGDYTRPWTDEDLREYFSITDEEWKEIDETVKG